MCDLCAIKDKVLRGGEFDGEIYYKEGFFVIVDSVLDKPGKDGFLPKLVFTKAHESDPLPPLKAAIIETARRMFRKRTFWFPQKPKGKELPREEWPAHWYFIIE